MAIGQEIEFTFITQDTEPVLHLHSGNGSEVYFLNGLSHKNKVAAFLVQDNEFCIKQT